MILTLGGAEIVPRTGSGEFERFMKSEGARRHHGTSRLNRSTRVASAGSFELRAEVVGMEYLKIGVNSEALF